MNNSNLCIGMFGTCGNSTFRQEILIPNFKSWDVEYFNPQVDEWKPEDAIIEAEHLANDEIILFPITSETYAQGSLSEVGFSILNAIKLDSRRDFVIMIENELDTELMKDEDRAKDSLRSRALVLQHLKKLKFDNIYVVNTFKEMLDVTKILYFARLQKEQLKRFNI